MNADISPEPAPVQVVQTRESKSKSPYGGKDIIDNSGRKTNTKKPSKSPNRSGTIDSKPMSPKKSSPARRGSAVRKADSIKKKSFTASS